MLKVRSAYFAVMLMLAVAACDGRKGGVRADRLDERGSAEASEGIDDSLERLEELERALMKAREEGNTAEIREIEALIDGVKDEPVGCDDSEPEVDLATRADDVWVRCEPLALRIGMNGQVKVLEVGGDEIPCLGPTIYRLNKARARVIGARPVDNGVRVALAVDGLEAAVVIEGGEEISVRFDTEARNVTFGFGLPASTRFHAPETANLAPIIDEKRLQDMPKRAVEGVPKYQLVLAELGHGFLAVEGRSDYRRPILGDNMVRAALYRLRHRDSNIAFEWTWRPDFPLVLSWTASMEKAAEKYCKWLEDFFHLRPLSGTPQAWVGDLKLLITLDMWRSNGDIAHTYQQAIDLAKDLYDAGAEGDILFYIPGWHGKYDAQYPDYTPKEELGGPEKFREMVDTFHECGYRVMIHVLPWGGDPFSPSFGDIRHLAGMSDDEEASALPPEAEEELRRGAATDYPPVGWPACYPLRRSNYDSGRQSLTKINRQNSKVTFATVELPRDLEARITVGGIQSPGTMTLSTNHRSFTVPAGHLLRQESYEFPYTFLLYKGQNEITIEFEGEDVPDLSQAWYRLHDCIYSDMIWTYPIVHMNTRHPEWVKLVSERVAETVREYDIDAIHLDAEFLWALEDLTGTIGGALKNSLPNVAFSTEKPVETAMMMFQLAQNAFVPDDSDDEEFAQEYSRLSQSISLPYRRHYLHLCSASGFVPVVSVCNIAKEPAPLDEGEAEFNRSLFERAGELGFVPNIRVNYRDYGLDEATKDAVLSVYFTGLEDD